MKNETHDPPAVVGIDKEAAGSGRGPNGRTHVGMMALSPDGKRKVLIILLILLSALTLSFLLGRVRIRPGKSKLEVGAGAPGGGVPPPLQS